MDSGGAARRQRRIAASGEVAAARVKRKKYSAVRERRGEGMMSRKQCMSLILGGTLACSAGAARAQQETPTPPPPGPMIHGGPGGEFMAPMGERIELLGFEGMHGGKTV